MFTLQDVLAAVNAAGFASKEELTGMFTVARLIIGQQELTRKVSALQTAKIAANAKADEEVRAVQAQIAGIEKQIVALAG